MQLKYIIQRDPIYHCLVSPGDDILQSCSVYNQGPDIAELRYRTFPSPQGFLLLPFPYFHPKPWKPLIPSALQFYNLFIARMLYKWNHTVCDLLELGVFIQPNSLEIYPIYYYSWIVPIYCWILFHCMDVSHFIHLSVGEYLGFFYFLAILKKAAMHFCVNTSFISLG